MNIEDYAIDLVILVIIFNIYSTRLKKCEKDYFIYTKSVRK